MQRIVRFAFTLLVCLAYDALAVNQGVHAFRVTVDTLANPNLPQIFWPAHYPMLDHSHPLPNKLAELYRHLPQ